MTRISVVLVVVVILIVGSTQISCRQLRTTHTVRTSRIGLNCSQHHITSWKVWQTRSCSYHLGVPYNPMHVSGAAPQSNYVLHWHMEKK